MAVLKSDGIAHFCTSEEVYLLSPNGLMADIEFTVTWICLALGAVHEVDM